MSFYTNGTAASNERVRIASDGRVYIGNTQDSSPYSWNLGLQVSGTSTNAGLSLRRDQSGSGGALLMFVKTGGALNGNTAPSDGDQIGGIYFNAADGTDVNNVAARISGTIDGTPGSNDTPGRLTFATTADGANSPTERLRIYSGGQVSIRNTNATSFNTGGDDLVIGNATDGQDAGMTLYSHSSDNGSIFFNDTADTGITGLIQYRHDVDCLRFFTATSERIRIDSSGRLLLGTTSTSGVSGSSDDIIIGSIGDSTDRGITFATTGIGAIRWADAGDNAMGRISYSNASDFMFFSTSNSEAMRIDSAGRVGIKNTNMSAFNDGMDDLVIGNGTNGTSPGMTIYSNSSDIGSISFRDSADTGISGLIQYRHLESPAYMRFLVEGTETAKFTTHGGIAFGSDTAAVNTLNDYEEGTWTPGVGGSSGSVTSYYNQEGGYTKIGRLVKCHFRIRVNDAGNAAGNMEITNLPFTVADTLPSTGLDGSGGPTYWAGQSASIVHMTMTPQGGTTKAWIYIATGATTVLSNLTNSNAFGGGWDVRAELMYFAA